MEKPLIEIAREKAEEIYRKINSYTNPSEMEGIEKEWIIKKIAEGLVNFVVETKIFVKED